METALRSLLIFTTLLMLASLGSLLSACGRADTPAANVAAAPQGPQQGTVPPPPGDSTPKAIDANAVATQPANEKTGNAGGSQQSTVTSAASGAPPYTLNAAPEGNPAPQQGSRGDDRSPGSSTPNAVSPRAGGPSGVDASRAPGPNGRDPDTVAPNAVSPSSGAPAGVAPNRSSNPATSPNSPASTPNATRPNS